MEKLTKEIEYYVDITCYNYCGGSPNNLSNGNEGERIGIFNTYKEAKKVYEELLTDEDLKKDIKNRGWYAYVVSLSNEYENIMHIEIIYVEENEEEEEERRRQINSNYYY